MIVARAELVARYERSLANNGYVQVLELGKRQERVTTGRKVSAGAPRFPFPNCRRSSERLSYERPEGVN